MPRRDARLAGEDFPLRRLLLAHHAHSIAVAGEVANLRHWVIAVINNNIIAIKNTNCNESGVWSEWLVLGVCA